MALPLDVVSDPEESEVASAVTQALISVGALAAYLRFSSVAAAVYELNGQQTSACVLGGLWAVPNSEPATPADLDQLRVAIDAGLGQSGGTRFGVELVDLPLGAAIRWSAALSDGPTCTMSFAVPVPGQAMAALITFAAVGPLAEAIADKFPGLAATLGVDAESFDAE